MNLLEIRTQFAKLSGRMDLVGTSYVDNGADYYLKAGVKLLDRLVEFDKDVVSVSSALTVDAYSISIASQRAVKKVWFNDGTDKWELVYLTPSEMTTEYEDYSSADSGTPAYFTNSIDTDQLTTPAIIIMPPTDTAGTVEVWFKRNTPFPSTDSATNFWFDNFEHLAVNAALYQLEVSYRNTQGQNDLMASIQLDLLGIEKDTVEDDADRATEMEG